MNLAQAFTPPVLPRGALESLYATAYALLAQERYTEAAPLFRVMVHSAPTDDRGWLALGACHEGLDQLEIAAELFGAASTVVQKPGKCCVAQARALRALGHREQADEALERAFVAAEADDDELLEAAIAHERRRS